MFALEGMAYVFRTWWFDHYHILEGASGAHRELLVTHMSQVMRTIWLDAREKAENVPGFYVCTFASVASVERFAVAGGAASKVDLPLVYFLSSAIASTPGLGMQKIASSAPECDFRAQLLVFMSVVDSRQAVDDPCFWITLGRDEASTFGTTAPPLESIPHVIQGGFDDDDDGGGGGNLDDLTALMSTMDMRTEEFSVARKDIRAMGKALSGCAGCGRRAAPGGSGDPRQRGGGFCHKCKHEWYCSRECQVNHWPIHKKTCIEMKRAVDVFRKAK
jgi:hypothetical protein